NQAIRIQPKDIAVTSFGNPTPLSAITLREDWRDTYSVRLGGHYTIIPGQLLVRGGAYYERAAVPAERLSVGAFDADKLGLTAGGRVDLPHGFWIDLAAGYVDWLARTVTNSQVLLSDPLSGKDQWPIANGTYTNAQIFVLAALGVKVDI